MPLRASQNDQLRICLEKVTICLTYDMPQIEQAIAAIRLFGSYIGQVEYEPLTKATPIADRRLRFSSRACEELERKKIVYLGQLLSQSQAFIHTLNNRASITAGLSHNNLALGQRLPNELQQKPKLNGKVFTWKNETPKRAGWYWVHGTESGSVPEIRFLEAGDKNWSLIAGPIKQPTT